LGSLDGITRTIDELHFAINRLNRRQGSADSRRAAAELFDVTAAELGRRLLPSVVARSSRPVVIVPTALLHDVPWRALPPLARRSVTLNPSVSAWATAERSRIAGRARGDEPRATGFLAGPGLEHAEREVAELGSLYPAARVVTGSGSTVTACLDLLADSEVVHIACHGTFRTDNPMFSALHLADGELVVYDFEQVNRLPEVVVISACSVANTKVLQGGSFLGLAAALTTFGASTVIAPLTPISDASSVELMHRLHEAMVAGSSPAEALALATAGAFVAFGC
jgi:CHAT domain-containing protein